jgi:hypothetical protein
LQEPEYIFKHWSWFALGIAHTPYPLATNLAHYSCHAIWTLLGLALWGIRDFLGHSDAYWSGRVYHHFTGYHHIERVFGGLPTGKH